MLQLDHEKIVKNLIAASKQKKRNVEDYRDGVEDVLYAITQAHPELVYEFHVLFQDIEEAFDNG